MTEHICIKTAFSCMCPSDRRMGTYNSEGCSQSGAGLKRGALRREFLLAGWGTELHGRVPPPQE